MPGWPASLSRDSAVFVFAHWWSVERFEAIEADFAVQLPKPPQTARWYTLAVVLIVVVAIVLLGWMPGSLALPGPLAAIVLLVVLRSPYAARRRVRDRERKACQYAFMQEEGSVCVVN